MVSCRVIIHLFYVIVSFRQSSPDWGVSISAVYRTTDAIAVKHSVQHIQQLSLESAECDRASFLCILLMFWIKWVYECRACCCHKFGWLEGNRLTGQSERCCRSLLVVYLKMADLCVYLEYPRWSAEVGVVSPPTKKFSWKTVLPQSGILGVAMPMHPQGLIFYDEFGFISCGTL